MLGPGAIAAGVRDTHGKFATPAPSATAALALAGNLAYSRAMGWVWLGLIGGATAAALWRAGVARDLWTLAAAALMLGAVGYAWQQRATLASHEVKADADPVRVDPDMVAFREAILPGAPGDAPTLAAADSHLRDGDTGAAARGVAEALGRDPGDAALWTGLGNMLVAHDSGQVSPAAAFAFRRALELAPGEPGPSFFLGLARAQAGDFAGAKRAWLVALALTPQDAPYRRDVAEHLAMLDQFQAMSAAAQPAP